MRKTIHPALLAATFANMERRIGLSLGGGKPISEFSVTQLSLQLSMYVLDKFRFYR
jgi:hypothetical protein